MSNVLYWIRKKGLGFAIKEAISRLFFAILKLRYSASNLQDIIIMESHNDFDSNCGAFYDYLIQHGVHERYKIVWLTKNKIPDNLPHNVKAFPIDRLSFRKNYYHCRARFILYEDRTVDRIWDEQIVVYCSHGGVSFKNVKGHLAVSEAVSYVLSSSINYDPLLCDNLSISYPNQKMLHLGFPSNDLLFREGRDELRKITKEPFERAILWMPTFRKSKSGRNDSNEEYPFGVPLIKSIKEFRTVDRFLQLNKALLIIKYHPMQDLTQVRLPSELGNIRFIDAAATKALGLDGYRLMACADAMIGDYSAAAYSFLLLNRPMAFVLSDLGNYAPGLTCRSIGDLDVLPGEKIYSFEDFLGFLENLVSKKDAFCEERKRLAEWLYTDIDGKASERLARFLHLI